MAELELKVSLCSFLPWSLVEHGTDWSLAPKSALIQLLFGVRKLPAISSATLCDEHKTVLLVVIGYRNKGGFQKPGSRRLGLEAAPYLKDHCEKKPVYTAPDKDSTGSDPPRSASGAGPPLLR